MDKKLAGLLGTVGAIAASLPAAAAPVNARPALQASSYADLFKPIPNAVAMLDAADSQAAAAEPVAPGLVQDVQFPSPPSPPPLRSAAAATITTTTITIITIMVRLWC